MADESLRRRTKAASAGGATLSLIAATVAALEASPWLWVPPAVVGVVLLSYVGIQALRGKGDAQPAMTKSARARDVGHGSMGGNIIQGSTVNVDVREPAPSAVPTRSFNQATGDAETELKALLRRLLDAQEDGVFRLGFSLSAAFQQAVADALEDQGLKSVRRVVDEAYDACERLSDRLQGRFWSGGAFPEPADAQIEESDRLPLTITKVKDGLEALRSLPGAP